MAQSAHDDANHPDSFMAEENVKGQHDTTRLQKEMEARRREMVKSVEDSREKLKGLLGPQQAGQENEAKAGEP